MNFTSSLNWLFFRKIRKTDYQTVRQKRKNGINLRGKVAIFLIVTISIDRPIKYYFENNTA